MAPYKLRLTGYVPEASLWMSLTKTGPQALRWTAYSMPRPILLSQVGLQGAVTPWSSFSSVRLLFPGTTAWVSFRFNGMFWLPYDPMIECGMGIAFIRGGPSDPSDVLELPTWYLHPPND
jgi:hypothetical protein